jgi:hypothetical protein
MKQTCPLCGNPAEYEMCHEPYCKHFTCPVCTEFFIDASSENHLGGLTEVFKTEFRQKLSDAARKTSPDQVFVIREPLPEERGGDGQSVARTNLVAKHLKRQR